MDRDEKRAAEIGRLLDVGMKPYDAADAEHASLQVAVIDTTKLHRRPKRGKRIAAMVAAAVVILAVGGALTATYGRSTGVSFYVEDGIGEVPAEVGHWLRTKTDERREVRFSDGSGIQIHAETETRIAQADREAVTVDLNRGSLAVHVTPHRGNRWTVRAGPFEVFVVGTRFTVGWDAARSRLDLNVATGRVRVRGPGIVADGVFVDAGNALQGDGETGVIAFGPDESLRNANLLRDTASDTESPAPELTADATPISVPSVEEDDNTVSARAMKAAETPRWKQYSLEKRFSEALALAKTRNLGRLSNTLPEKDLWLLASTARYARDAGSAALLFTTFRKRFAQSTERATAAYLLGLQATNTGGRRQEAIRWFETYLSEAPNGPLAEAALSRLIRLHQTSGARQKAARLSSEYLARFPAGPFAEQAKKASQP